MFSETFINIYRLYKKNYYDFTNCTKDLSIQEVISLDIIHLLDRPTILQFANYLKISQPNATYKINQLCEKGYLKKINNPEDKRVFYLEVTDKYYNELNFDEAYVNESINTIIKTLSSEELASLTEMMAKIEAALTK